MPPFLAAPRKPLALKDNVRLNKEVRPPATVGAELVLLDEGYFKRTEDECRSGFQC